MPLRALRLRSCDRHPGTYRRHAIAGPGLAALLVAACSGPTRPSVTSITEVSTASSTTDVAAQCVDAINADRATLGLAAYARWTSGETCADTQAQSDGATGMVHGAFGQCGEIAQNECGAFNGTPASTIGECLAFMWAEGPGADFELHGHYINMSSPAYTTVACGFATTTSGQVWLVQNFR